MSLWTTSTRLLSVTGVNSTEIVRKDELLAFNSKFPSANVDALNDGRMLMSPLPSHSSSTSIGNQYHTEPSRVCQAAGRGSGRGGES